MVWSEELQAFVIATYHPAAVLHGNFGYFDDIYDTTKRAIHFAQGISPLPAKRLELDWELCTTPQRSIDALLDISAKSNFVLAVDTESKTRHKHQPRALEDEWIMLQMYDGEKAYAFNMRMLTRHVFFMSLLAKLMLRDDLMVLMHNASYDLTVFSANGLPWPKDVRDTMVLGLGLTERGEQVGLEALARMYCNAGLYKAVLGPYNWMLGPRNKEEWFRLAEYGCRDVYYTYELGALLPAFVRDEGTMLLCKSLLLPAQKAFAKIGHDGSAKIDLPYAKALEAEWVPIIDEATKEMQTYAREMGFPHDPTYVRAQQKGIPCPICVDATRYDLLAPHPRTLWRDILHSEMGDPSCPRCMKRRFILVIDDDLNVRSNRQLQHLAFDILGLQHPERKRSCEEAMLAANESHQFVKHIRAIRELDHLLRNYIRGISDDVWIDGRLHPDFLLFGTVTGRLSIRNPPVQTLPKWGVNPKLAKLVRKLFVGSQMEFEDEEELEAAGRDDSSVQSSEGVGVVVLDRTRDV